MNESETDILREVSKPLEVDDHSLLKQISQNFFDRGVRDLVIITLGAKVRTFLLRQRPF